MFDHGVEQRVLTVSSLNNQIKALMEATFIGIYVGGEISNITYHSSGHIYFSIKDETSSIRCVMFKGQASRLKFRLENGLKVLISGSITLYAPRGEYQIQCQSVEPEGRGSLALAFEQLKTKLEGLGYFDPSCKKTLPKFVQRVAIVTSSTGAALQDMIRVASSRWPLVKLVVINTLVQGESAKESIVASLKKADTLGCDVIVVGRGGGSIEDLWAFNEECVARAIYEASTPIVSAVGHEIDWVISDFVADVRAATPSNAMEIILPDARDVMMSLDEIKGYLEEKMNRIISQKKVLTQSLQESLSHFNPVVKLSLQKKELLTFQEHLRVTCLRSIEARVGGVKPLQEMLHTAIAHRLEEKKRECEWIALRFRESDPSVMVRPQTAMIVKKGKRVALEDVFEGETIVLESLQTVVEAVVTKKSSPNGEIKQNIS